MADKKILNHKDIDFISHLRKRQMAVS